MKKSKQSVISTKNNRRLKLTVMLGMLAVVLSFGVTGSDRGVNSGGGIFDRLFAYAEGEDASSDASGNGEESNLLDAKMGRVEFWEWNQLTKKNFAEYMDDGEYHPSMMFYYDTNSVRDKNMWSTMTPVGFISTYDDRKHIMRGFSDSDYSEYWDPYTTDEGRWNDFNNSAFNIGASNGNFWNGFAEKQSKLIKMDGQGTSLNYSGYSKKTRFFTSGADGSYGVPFIKSKRSGTNIIGDLKSGGHWTQWCSEVSIYLQRGSEYGKAGAGLNMGKRNEDTYIECWKGQEGKQPAIKALKGTSGGASSGGVHNQGKCFTMHPFSGDENSEFWVGRCMVGMTDDQIDYAKCDDNDHDDDYRTIPSLAVTRSGYLVAYDAKPLNGYGGGKVDVKNFSTQWSNHYVARNIFWNETPGVYGVFKWYVGKRHVFSSIPSMEIPKGKLKPYTAKDMLNAENDEDPTEGIIIPYGETLTINGGTVTIECSVINNGKIVVKNGGNLIIKDGGCISSFTDKVDGSIECNDGSIVVMPGGKLLATDGEVNFCCSSTLINYGTTSIKLINMDSSSKLENRKDGAFFLGLKRKDNLVLMNTEKVTATSIGNTEYVTSKSDEEYINTKTNTPCRIRIFEKSSRFATRKVNLNGVMVEIPIPSVIYEFEVRFYEEAGVHAGMFTEEVIPDSGTDGYEKALGLVRCRLDNMGYKNRVYAGIVCTYGNQPTVLNEKTAVFNGKSASHDYLNGIKLTVPKY